MRPRAVSWRQTPSNRARLVVAGLALALVVAGCDGGDPNGTLSVRGDRIVHLTNEGPLSGRIASGALYVPGPGVDPWTATFGGPRLCADTQVEPDSDGGRIVLEGVRWDASVVPVSVEPQLRRAGARDGPEMIKLGSYPRFAEPYSDGVGYGGTWLRSIAGQKIVLPCERTSDGFVELLMAITFDAGGGRVDTTYVDYTYDGDRYTLVIDFAFAGCGSDLTTAGDLENCSGW